jgi:hypothetical protein
MSQKCWVRFAQLALRVAEQSLPGYAHKFSPQRYRLAQLAGCVCLKQYLRLDWRGIEQLLQLSPPLRQALGLRDVPDHTTLCRFAARWLTAPTLGGLLARLLVCCGLRQVDVAVDSTGLEADTASLYFATRRGTHRRQAYPKLSISVVIGALVAVSAVADWGACNDKTELPQLLTETMQRVRVGQLYADAGYDAEWVHQVCRGAGIGSWIPPVKHRADGKVGGHWRAQMARGLPPHYGRRWAVESFISGLKRVVGAHLQARQPQRQLEETLLKAVVYSIHR